MISRSLEGQPQRTAQTDDQSFNLRNLERVVSRADYEIFQNLRLFVERIMLYRITRTNRKGAELARFAMYLLEAAKLGEDPDKAAPSDELSSIKALENEKLSATDVAGLFSALADALENLNARQLYYFLDKLRRN